MPCGGNVGYSPQQAGLVDTYVSVVDLLAHANYTFEVEAVNGVSDLSRTQRLFAAVSIATSQASKESDWLIEIEFWGLARFQNKVLHPNIHPSLYTNNYC